MATIKNAVVQALVDGVLTELMIKTKTDNVWVDDSTNLSAKLSEMIAAINLRAKSEDVTAEIEAAIAALVDSAPETFDTLKEISEYIEEHQEVVEALNAAISNKANQSDLDALEDTVETVKTTADTALTNAATAQSTADAAQAAVDALGALASKDTVSESDLDSALAEKINTSFDAATIYVSSTQPSDLEAGDLWFNISD